MIRMLAVLLTVAGFAITMSSSLVAKDAPATQKSACACKECKCKECKCTDGCACCDKGKSHVCKDGEKCCEKTSK